MEERDVATDDLAGLPVEEAATRVAAENGSLDVETARRVLETVSQDGVVSRSGVESALADASKVVSTPETRTELAGHALEDARAAAEPVADLDSVATRIEGFEARLAAIESDVDDLGEALQAVIADAEDGAIYELAERLRQVTTRANELQREADELQVELEEFQRWLENPDRRYEELSEELDAVEDYLDDIDGTIERLDASSRRENPGVEWTEASLQSRVAELLTADIRAELDDLRTWAAREGLDTNRTEPIAERLAALEDRAETLEARLDRVAEPAWRERFGNAVESFETATADIDPPVPWDRVETALEKHRPDATRDGPA